VGTRPTFYASSAARNKLRKEVNEVRLFTNPDKCEAMTDWTSVSQGHISNWSVISVILTYIYHTITTGENDTKVRIGKAATVFGKNF